MAKDAGCLHRFKQRERETHYRFKQRERPIRTPHFTLTNTANCRNSRFELRLLCALCIAGIPDLLQTHLRAEL